MQVAASSGEEIFETQITASIETDLREGRGCPMERGPLLRAWEQLHSLPECVLGGRLTGKEADSDDPTHSNFNVQTNPCSQAEQMVLGHWPVLL